MSMLTHAHSVGTSMILTQSLETFWDVLPAGTKVVVFSVEDHGIKLIPEDKDHSFYKPKHPYFQNFYYDFGREIEPKDVAIFLSDHEINTHVEIC